MKPENSDYKYTKDLLTGNILNSSDDSSDDEDFVCDSENADDNEFSSENSNDSFSNETDESENTLQNLSDHEKPNISSKDEKRNSKKAYSEIVTDDRKAIQLLVSKKNECRICCVCLNYEYNKSLDELLECDSCGFYIHEGCYGLNDTASRYSNISSASTEPWFCNSCLLGDAVNTEFNLNKRTVHQCELCPNTECGLMKETETGRFVHILCALYTSGVAFQDTDKLWPVVLDEIPYQRWGEQACSLCEDTRLSRTGICIRCDAGLCKTYFHATCAQAHGYLADPMQQVEQYESDPFLAYCKQHMESSLIKSRKTSYLAMISNFKSKAPDSNNGRNFLKNEFKDRYLLKLKSAKEDYDIQRQKMNKPLINDHKIPRMITTCPSALKMLLAKNSVNSDEINGNDAFISEQRMHHMSKSVTFTEDFIKYYFEREKKMKQYSISLNQMKESQQKLIIEELELRESYDNLLKKRENLKNKCLRNIEMLKTFGELIEELKLKKSHAFLNNLSELIMECEEQTEEKSLVENSIKSEQMPSSPIAPKCRSYQAKAFKFSEKVNKTTLESLCVNCKKKINAHLLIDCDTCKEFYHITCLSPPLSSVPKKTKLYGWECSNCVRLKESDNSEAEEKNKIDLDAPRSLRVKRTKKNSFDSSQFNYGFFMKKKHKRPRKNKSLKNQTIQDSSLSEVEQMMNFTSKSSLNESIQKSAILGKSLAKKHKPDSLLKFGKTNQKKSHLCSMNNSHSISSSNSEQIKKKSKRTRSLSDQINDTIEKTIESVIENKRPLKVKKNTVSLNI